MPQYRNTENTVEFSYSRLAEPRSEAELVELVKECARLGRKLKCVGTRNNFNHISKSEDTLVDLSGIEDLNKIIRIDRQQMSVTIGSGMTIANAVDALNKEGLHFAILGGWHGQTLGGAIATSTHGSCFASGSLSDYVTGMEAILSNGEKIGVIEGEEALKAWRVNLGQLGIVTSVTLRVVRSFYLACTIQDDDDDRIGFEALIRRVRLWDADGSPYVSLLWLPYYGDNGRTLLRQLLPSSATCPNARAISYENRWASRDGNLRKNATEDRAAVILGKSFVRHPRLYKNLWSNAMANAFLDDEGIEDRSFRLFCYEQFREPTENHWLRQVLSVEYALDASRLELVLDELRGVIREYFRQGIVANYPRFHVRFANASDKTWLGTNSGRRTAYFNTYFSAAGLRSRQIPLAIAIESVLDAHGGRPHWGKFRHLGGDSGYQTTYGSDWERFERYRMAIDPNGMFSDGREMFSGVNLHNHDTLINGPFTSLNPDNYGRIHYLGGRSSDFG